jgi:hypothetical protein
MRILLQFLGANYALIGELAAMELKYPRVSLASLSSSSLNTPLHIHVQAAGWSLTLVHGWVDTFGRRPPTAPAAPKRLGKQVSREGPVSCEPECAV